MMICCECKKDLSVAGDYDWTVCIGCRNYVCYDCCVGPVFKGRCRECVNGKVGLDD